ncbi:hypothetical protein LBW89_08745 [Paenibacillus sp. alder61]|uniref:hypothetical protein n=1 Tax=Paenibacillus TaxID=44249 RepID=UPI0014782AFE|nr:MULTISPECIES: hypothetical protein [Paenibacillus]MCA1293104.1 hypothetical protein [Paenibacillus sp. alder61]
MIQSRILSEGIVLQRGAKVNIWGKMDHPQTVPGSWAELGHESMRGRWRLCPGAGGDIRQHRCSEARGDSGAGSCPVRLVQ